MKQVTLRFLIKSQNCDLNIEAEAVQKQEVSAIAESMDCVNEFIFRYLSPLIKKIKP